MANSSDLAKATGTDVALLLAELRLTTLQQAESPDDDEILQIHRIILRTPPASRQIVELIERLQAP
jgi:hypothetical protein